MNFFQHQDKARSKTRKLVGLFLLAVILIAGVIGCLVVFFFSRSNYSPYQSAGQNFINNFDGILFLETGVAVMILISLISLFKRIELSSGGKVIAEKLGGRLINEDSKNFSERQLLNIVTEMAIASGVAVPPVYVIEEQGINAFAAGFAINDAVIGVTRGAMENLSRDELQGVIAHEFSHIFNGDMRLNIKLIAILHGILIIGILGDLVMRSSAGGSFSGNRERNRGAAQMMFFGLALIIIGFIGTFFGNLIKASVSRQREFLADASAVQFTRNPLGIGSALKKIGAFSVGSKISNPHTSEVSHMFFAQSLSGFSSNFMATHPPLVTRILAIDPNWDGNFEEIAPKENAEFASPWQKADNKRKTVSFASMAGMMIQNIGNIDEKSINQAHDLLGSIPQIIKDETTNPFGARAVIYSLIIAENVGDGAKELKILQENCDTAIFELTEKLFQQIDKLDKKFRLTLIDLSIPSLKKLSLTQYQNFKKTVQLLVDADSKVNLFEWSIMRILFNHLDREFDKNYAEKKPIYKLPEVQDEIGLVLSLMARVGNKDLKIAGEVFNATIRDQNLPKISFSEAARINIADLDKSIAKLEKLYPLEKEKLLKLCNICLLQNGILFSEIELLRAFASALNCPMPLVEETNNG
jgi:Zn-dependent protease with chaperone function